MGIRDDERYGRDARWRNRADSGEEIDYRWEGDRGPRDDDDRDDTDRGYDEAARSGASRYGFVEGRGGVFGTTGGGTYNGGFPIIERAGIYDRGGAPGPFEPGETRRGSRGREADTYESTWLESWHDGPHAGKGPRRYKRADERIVEEVSERLTRHAAIDATEIEVTCENGEVTLAGFVESRRAKKLSERIAETVFGVEDVHNRLKVR